MSTTQIPTGTPAQEPAPPPRQDPGDLYDSQHWESAYREMHDVPALLIQLQDDLSRSRRREAFWISVVVHLLLVILFINADKFDRLLPRRPVLVVAPNDWMRQRELTYVESPPDEQKVTKKPNTNIISDKDRTAQSRTPQLDREELKKILDSARAGRPGPSAPQGQQAQPPQQAMAQSEAPQQQQQASAAPPPVTNQSAKLTMPQQNTGPKPSFQTNTLSAGSAIEQAARAAIANRGSMVGGGEGGDYGLGQGKRGAKAFGDFELLTDTQGVDFGPYLQRVLHDVRENWYQLIPEVARPPLMKKGKVSIEFAIMKDGRVAGLRYDSSSGDVSLDRAAYGGITASNPFPPLPSEFPGQYLALRFHFYYNPDSNDLR